MKSIYLSFIFVVILCSCSTVSQPSYSMPEKAIDSKDTIIYVQLEGLDYNTVNELNNALISHGFITQQVTSSKHIPDLSTKISTGSCFSISPSVAITNSHVLEYKEKFLYKNNQYYPIDVIYNDPTNDLAIIKVNDFTFPFSFTVQTTDDYSLGKDVYALGFPMTDLLGQDIRITKGIINAKSGLNGDKNVIQISAQVQPGNSGGPIIYADDFSTAIGVVSSKVSDLYSLKNKGTVLQNVNFAIKSSLLPNDNNSYLTDNKKPSTLEEATEAVGLIYTTETPTSPYSNRLLSVLNLNTTRYDTYTQYGLITEYSILINLKLLDVDSDRIICYFIQTFNSPSRSINEPLKKFIDNFIAELEKQNLLLK